jgi:hypothetical protein
VQLEKLGQLKNSSDLIGNQIRDFPACSIVPQPNSLNRTLSPPERKINFGRQKVVGITVRLGTGPSCLSVDITEEE